MIENQTITDECCHLSSSNLGLISDMFRSYFELIFVGIGTTTLSVCGLLTNSVNIFVFKRQGLKDGVTISLSFLSFSDMLANIASVFMGICILCDRFGVLHDVIDWTDLKAVAFAWPRTMFVDLSTYTTVFVTVERSLCVIMPLKFKGLVTPSRTVKIILIIYIVVLAFYAPLFATYGLHWVFNEITNTTVLTQWFSYNRVQTEVIFHAIIGLTTPLLGFATVTVCTYCMIVRLKQSARFRIKATKSLYHASRGEIVANNSSTTNLAAAVADVGASERLSGKDKRVVEVVVLVAVVFIVCTTPLLVTILSRRIHLGLSAGGTNENLMWVMFAVVYFCSSINTSINMFIYIRSSTKYRQIFLQTFCGSLVTFDAAGSSVSAITEGA